MKAHIKLFLVTALMGMPFLSFSQVETIKLNPEKVKKYAPYVEARHGYQPNGFDQWKSTNKLLYTKEMWYYTESFYIKRNHLNEGVAMDESLIDISRFETNRKESEEAIVTLPGYRDVIVLLPSNKLIYKP